MIDTNTKNETSEPVTGVYVSVTSDRKPYQAPGLKPLGGFTARTLGGGGSLDDGNRSDRIGG